MEDYNKLNEIHIVDFLESNGHFRDKKSSNSYRTVFLSPFTNEKTPSFCVNNYKNVFFDFSGGMGGNLYQLVKLFKEKNINISEIITERSSPMPVFKEKPKTEILSVNSLTNKYLIDYLVKERGINIHITKQYCCEIRTRIGDKTYFGIGFKNDKGGYELRNASFKGCTSPKGITTFNWGGNKINIFEGFMDFLSALTYLNTMKLKNTTIILNSCVFAEMLESDKEYNIFTDNDAAGNSVIEVLAPNNTINDFRNIFAPHNDFNDYFVSLKKK
jgi:hypothetical protein